MFEVFERFGTKNPLSKLKLHQYLGGKECICGKTKKKMSWECPSCLKIRPKNNIKEACDIHTEKIVEILTFYRDNHGLSE